MHALKRCLRRKNCQNVAKAHQKVNLTKLILALNFGLMTAGLVSSAPDSTGVRTPLKLKHTLMALWILDNTFIMASPNDAASTDKNKLFIEYIGSQKHEH